MWLEVRKDKIDVLLNTDLIRWVTIQKSERLGVEDENSKFGWLVIINAEDDDYWFLFEKLEDARAFFVGFTMALNGHDFVVKFDDADWFIKPLKRNKSEILTEYLRKLEYLEGKV